MIVIQFFRDYFNSVNEKKARTLRWMILIIFISSFVSGGLNAGLLGLTNHHLNAQDYTKAAIIIFASLCVLMPLLRFVAETTLNLFLLKVVKDMQVNFCRQVLLAPLSSIEKEGAHRYSAIMSQDLKIIAEGLLASVLVCMHLSLVIGCLGYMAWLSWQAFLFTLVFILFGYLTEGMIANRAVTHFRKARQFLDLLYEHWHALIVGNKELKLHRGRRMAFYREHFKPTVEEHRIHRFRGYKFFSAANSYVSVLYFLLLGILLFGFTLLFDLGRETQTGFALALLFILEPLSLAIVRVRTVSEAGVSVNKVKKVGLQLSEMTKDATLDEVPQPLPAWQSLEIKNMVYHYEREDESRKVSRFRLGPINLRFRPGDFVMIAGGNGSGKTTLGKLLTGLYVPDSGEILYNGKPINDENRDAYRQLFSAIFVDFYLFPSLLGLNTDRLNERARAYLKKLEIDHKVDIDGGELSTTSLSQGQRKRLALLTAYLEDRPFYVFDEWTSNQDPRFRDIFYEEIIPDLLSRGKTVVVISHDDTYFDKADRFVKLDYGQLVDNADSAPLAPDWAGSVADQPAGG